MMQQLRHQGHKASVVGALGVIIMSVQITLRVDMEGFATMMSPKIVKLEGIQIVKTLRHLLLRRRRRRRQHNLGRRRQRQLCQKVRASRPSRLDASMVSRMFLLIISFAARVGILVSTCGDKALAVALALFTTHTVNSAATTASIKTMRANAMNSTHKMTL